MQAILLRELKSPLLKSCSLKFLRTYGELVEKSTSKSKSKKRYAIRHIPIPVDNQSNVLPGSEMVRSSTFVPSANEDKFLRCLYEDCRTVYEVFQRGARVSNDGRCLGWRENGSKCYQWIHYMEVLRRARNLGCGLSYLGLKHGALVGIYAQNCPEWVMCELGMFSYSMITVPLYATLGANACSFIIKQADLNTVVCDVDEKVNFLLNEAPNCLKRIIHIKKVKRETEDRAKKGGVKLIAFEQLEQMGSANLHEFPEKPPLPDDICIISYTSGTTGNPKGAIISHENLVSVSSAGLMNFGEHKPRPGDIMMSFLPLAHIFERLAELVVIMEGGSLGFFSGDIRNILEDMKVLKPTLLPAVPRVLNRCHEAFYSKIKGSFLKRTLCELALSRKQALIQNGILPRKDTIWDALVFRKVQEEFGGRIRLMLVGSAPVSETVLTFCRCALGCVILEGYGQTECSAGAATTCIKDHTSGHVGPPLACCWVKLVDVPELDSYAKDGRGEICVKGANVFKGYFKDPERTRETIDEDGWLHTGDIGFWQPNGTLKIIDRKKQMFKLSQGEYIAPEKIEIIYGRSKHVSQVYVHGDSFKSCLVAIVVPDEETLQSYYSQQKQQNKSLSENEQLKKMILEDIVKIGKESGLHSFEQVKDIYLHEEPFSVQNGLLTPTFKAKRQELKIHFKPQLEAMYSKLN